MPWRLPVLDWPARYHAHLVARTEALSPQTRWLEVRPLLTPWIIPIVIGVGLCWALNLDELHRIMVLIPSALIGLGGMIYVGSVVMYYGVRADISRMKEAKRRGE